MDKRPAIDRAVTRTAGVTLNMVPGRTVADTRTQELFDAQCCVRLGLPDFVMSEEE